MAFCLLVVLALLLGAFVLKELRVLAGVLPNLEQTALSGIALVKNWSFTLSSHAPESLQPLLRENLGEMFSDSTAMLGKFSEFLLSSAGNLLSHVPDSALSLGTGILSAFLISAKLPRIRRQILHRISRERLRELQAVGRRIKTALGGWFLAQAKLMGITLMILLPGFLLLRIPNGPIWAIGVCLVDAFPVLGTGTVLLPWSLISFLEGNTPLAIGLLGIYATITLTRSLLEPKLVGSHLGLDPLATLAALYIGYRLWGITGMIIAPLLAVTALQLVPDPK